MSIISNIRSFFDKKNKFNEQERIIRHNHEIVLKDKCEKWKREILPEINRRIGDNEFEGYLSNDNFTDRYSDDMTVMKMVVSELKKEFAHYDFKLVHKEALPQFKSDGNHANKYEIYWKLK
jgi:hypothetical protein